MTPRPYPIGATVRLRSGVEVKVEGWRGPYSAETSDGYVTPLSMIEGLAQPADDPLADVAFEDDAIDRQSVDQADMLGSWEDEQGQAA